MALLATGPALDPFEAVIVGDEAILAARLDADSSVLTAYSPDGFTLMHLAPWAGQPGTTSLLIKRRADLNAVSKNFLQNQPLNAAVAGPNAETRAACVALLLDAGADPNNRQHGGYMPIHSAAQHGDTAAAEALAGARRRARNVLGRGQVGRRLCPRGWVREPGGADRRAMSERSAMTRR